MLKKRWVKTPPLPTIASPPRVQTDFENSAKIWHSVIFQVPFQPNRTCFLKVRVLLNQTRIKKMKFSLNQNSPFFNNGVFKA